MQLGKTKCFFVGVIMTLGLLALGSPAMATIDVQSNGLDGPLNITSDTVIDLSDPAVVTDAAWDAATPGIGAYDATRWAIVFHYSEVNIATGATLTFVNHPKNAPVVWLVAGNVTIGGVIDLTGDSGTIYGDEATGGPGGFRGGRGYSSGGPRGWGLGPGGGLSEGSSGGSGSFGAAGNFSSPTYGSPELIPLMGGSGGAGSARSLPDSGGGAGGGAILIAAANGVVLDGFIYANGGPSSNGNAGGGSGGGIRIIADQFTGGSAGELRAIGGWGRSWGGGGRIAISANNGPEGFLGTSDPTPALPPLTIPPQIWPNSSTPEASVIELAGIAVPSDPSGSFSYPRQDLLINTTGDVSVRIETHNVPQTSTVSVFVTKSRGTRINPPTQAVFESGSTALAYWVATIPATNITNGSFAIQARAILP